MININKNSNLKELNIKKGMFVKKPFCTLWFEIDHVFDTALTHAERDNTKQYNDYSTINHITHIKETITPYDRVIFLDGSRTFYDKFYPNAQVKIIPIP